MDMIHQAASAANLAQLTLEKGSALGKSSRADGSGCNEMSQGHVHGASLHHVDLSNNVQGCMES